MIRRFITSCLVLGTLAVAMPAMAQEAKPTKPTDSTANGAVSNQSQKNAKKKIDAQIDKLSQQVDLTSDQKEQLRTKLQKDNQETQKLWRQFADAHAQVIREEAEMLAAMQDVMEPEQKQRAQQNMQAKAKASKANNNSAAHRAGSSGDQHGANATKDQHAANANANANKDQHASDQANKKKVKVAASASAKAGSDDSNAATQSSTAAQSAQHAGNNVSGTPNSADQSGDQRQTEEYVWTMVIVPAQLELEPLGLSAEQQQQCDEVCREYHRSLVQGWQKIDQLHDQLVAVEAQQILDVEKILTDAQRQKLMNARRDSSKKNQTSESKSKS